MAVNSGNDKVVRTGVCATFFCIFYTLGEKFGTVFATCIYVWQHECRNMYLGQWNMVSPCTITWYVLLATTP